MGSNREGACKRWSAKRKAEIVVRLFKGERLDALSRETGQSAVWSYPGFVDSSTLGLQALFSGQFRCSKRMGDS